MRLLKAKLDTIKENVIEASNLVQYLITKIIFEDKFHAFRTQVFITNLNLKVPPELLRLAR